MIEDACTNLDELTIFQLTMLVKKRYCMHVHIVDRGTDGAAGYTTGISRTPSHLDRMSIRVHEKSS